jgi:hypothetical protein
MMAGVSAMGGRHGPPSFARCAGLSPPDMAYPLESCRLAEVFSGALARARPDAAPDKLKVGLGIRPETGQRTPIAAPSSRPIVQILGSTPLRHELFFADAENPDRPGKPRHVIGLQLFCHVSDAAPGDPLDARFERFVTRQTYTVEFKPQQVGKKAFYYARWQIATGDTGPWSAVASMTVAG